MTAIRPAVFVCVIGGLISPPEAAPQATVTGLVADSVGQPLSGALVFLAPGQQYTLTDLAGAFQLGPVADDQYVLSYRMAGYTPRSFSIALAAGTRDLGSVALQAGTDPAATLRGAVMERTTGTPLARATVEVNGRLIAETDSTGIFDVAAVPIQWGPNQLRVLHRSFTDAEVIDDFWVGEPSETFEFAVLLDVEPVDLPGVTVEAARVPVRLQGFYQRMENVPGVFLTRADILAREPRRVTDLLAPMRSTRRSRAASSFGRAMDSECRVPLVFIDGQLVGDANRPIYVDPNMQPSINQYLDPDQVEAIEIYDAVASVPAQFSLLGSGCGVVMVWTR